jgi:glutamate formiminotransferase
VVNVSEGRDQGVLALLAGSCGPCLLDVHSDVHHNRSVLTLAGPPGEVEPAVRELARVTVCQLDLSRHRGVHPRFGVLDVVPFVGLEGWPVRDARPGGRAAMAAVAARDSFAAWAARELGLPVFLYGPERSLPDVRRAAWRHLAPDLGPPAPHPTAGSVAAGWRPLMVAYNLWMAEEVGLKEAKAIVARLRAPEVRALAFQVGAYFQVSCNLIRPLQVGPAEVWDEVSRWARVSRGEVVGLVPRTVLAATAEDRWAELGLSANLTIEARLSERSGRRSGTEAAARLRPPREPGPPG